MYWLQQRYICDEVHVCSHLLFQANYYDMVYQNPAQSREGSGSNFQGKSVQYLACCLRTVGLTDKTNHSSLCEIDDQYRIEMSAQ